MIATKTLFGYSIKNGPSRTDLIHAFDCAGDDYLEKPVLFEIVENCMTSDGKKFYRAVQVHDTRIPGLRYDGNSKYAFVIEGNISICNLDKTYADPLNCKFIACYDATTGKGNANFLVPD